MSTYEEYRALRRQCGYLDEFALYEQVWNGCDADAQQNMLAQLRAGAAERNAALAKFGGDHW